MMRPRAGMPGRSHLPGRTRAQRRVARPARGDGAHRRRLGVRLLRTCRGRRGCRWRRGCRHRRGGAPAGLRRVEHRHHLPLLWPRHGCVQRVRRGGHDGRGVGQRAAGLHHRRVRLQRRWGAGPHRRRPGRRPHRGALWQWGAEATGQALGPLRSEHRLAGQQHSEALFVIVDLGGAADREVEPAVTVDVLSARDGLLAKDS